MKFRDDAKLNIRGRVEIFDDNGNVILDTTNMIMSRVRLACLYNLFRDQKILITGQTNDYFPVSENADQYPNAVPIICGFMFGDNGCNNSNPPEITVPNPRDNYKLSKTENSKAFHPIPFITTIDGQGNMVNTPSVINSAGSFNNIKDFINNPVIHDNKIITSGSVIKYFPITVDGVTDNNYYCKAIDINNSQIKINQENDEFEYIINFKIEPQDLVGATFSELGLVMANCNVTNGIITDIDTSTVSLASRLTFSPISLSSQLLTSSNVKYHIYM